ncbi:unnamed protein product [Rhodiola kirilowii]
MASRRLRAFKRWMKHQGIECSDALSLTDSDQQGISVIALCDLHANDVVATIPKSACLTIQTSGAREMIESAGLDGHLGLAVAVMYEISLGEQSPWAGYLQLLPEKEEGVPLVWTLDEVDFMLCGTELHKTVREDKGLVFEDWKECIWPLATSSFSNVNLDFFGVEKYFAAKTLVSSRLFEIDDFHGFGMVPLADLFNHKTGAEDVHFTLSPSLSDSDSASEKHGDTHIEEQSSSDVMESREEDIDDDMGSPLTTESDDSILLEMILVKDVISGSEVFNTYGTLSNAALLHRYGFTEANNPYDIVNIDLELVRQSTSSLYTERYMRSRVALWKRLDLARLETEYFEISSEGQPELELLILLYIISLPEEVNYLLELATSTGDASNKAKVENLPKECALIFKTRQETSTKLQTGRVCDALLSIANLRETLYNSDSLQKDLEVMKTYCPNRDRKRYHSLMLRISERNILHKLRLYAAAGKASTCHIKTPKRSSSRKKRKRA